MNAWARVRCLWSGCRFENTSCICTRCGREEHHWSDFARLLEHSFEFIGPQNDGRMRYRDVGLYLYTCSRCGMKRTKREAKIFLSDT